MSLNDLNDGLPDALQPLVDYIRTDHEYRAPVVCFVGTDQMVEVDPGEEIALEDEERFVEAILQANGLGLTGAVIFCRHPRAEDQLRMIVAGEDEFRFFRVPPMGPVLEDARPGFWALRPMAAEDRPEGGGTPGLH
ncbi:hypothetical protein [Wenxinia saemankumensis]|uniref:Uncharacterized protein n=1 Tax=Wenxinia saemankumensis TaxID=1447782 RepID=A0A1M6GZN6_9RHOB|nr:hypothetical protein [Wenxinia saemankumensis]SHJ15421.1 hypothetical protein SAMN05444417_3023 [Wenxinia saemankumensis]